MKSIEYSTELPGASHWSLIMRRGTEMRLTDIEGDANVGMFFFNLQNYLERYNAPDTLKCQHTFKLTRANCLYSDMGRIFCSIVEDDVGWHESVCGNITADQVAQRWGGRDYQADRNHWHQNGYDAFLVELTKYGLGRADLAANVNWFSKVLADENGELTLQQGNSKPGDAISLRFEMDTLVMLHTCPHPLDRSDSYPCKPVKIELGLAEPVSDDDDCRNSRPENQRGFQNNALYHLGL
jgi:urea carboxylase-associated protein 2